MGRAVIFNRLVRKASLSHPVAGTCEPCQAVQGPQVPKGSSSTHWGSALGSREPLSVLEQRSTMSGKMSLMTLWRIEHRDGAKVPRGDEKGFEKPTGLALLAWAWWGRAREQKQQGRVRMRAGSSRKGMKAGLRLEGS